MCHDEQLFQMKYGDTYNFDKSFANVEELFAKYDYVVGNLETVLTDGPYNGFPKFSTPKEFCASLIKAGVNCFMLANNHICDMGMKGVKSTISFLESNEIAYTGVSIDSKPEPVILGETAIINYTSEMNIEDRDVKYNDAHDFNSMKKDIDKVREDGAKIVIFIMHWGKEYEKVHTREQEMLAKKIISYGADMIIGSHPHIIEDEDEINGKTVIYSIGNFISSQTGDSTKGLGVDVEIYNGEIKKIKRLNFQTKNDGNVITVERV